MPPTTAGSPAQQHTIYSLTSGAATNLNTCRAATNLNTCHTVTPAGVLCNSLLHSKPCALIWGFVCMVLVHEVEGVTFQPFAAGAQAGLGYLCQRSYSKTKDEWSYQINHLYLQTWPAQSAP